MPLKNSVFLFIIIFTCSLIRAQEPTTLKTKNVEFSIQITHFTIEGMACQEGCADTIAANLEKAEGVLSAEVNYSTGKAIIKFDNTIIKLKKIENIITGTKVKAYVYTIKNQNIK